MSSFHRSAVALDNLLIGLARNYHKDVRRLKKIAKAKDDRGQDGFGYFVVQDADLREGFVEYIENGLGDYFPMINKREVARAILRMVDHFDEQRASLPKTRDQ